jgi:hypothetical protein
MADINTYTPESVRINDKILASDAISGATKNIIAGDIAELAGCKVYRAFLNQTATNAPVPTIVGTNTIGTLVWARSTTGIYTATLVNGFVGNVTMITGAAGPGSLPTRFGFTKNSSDTITINVYSNNVSVDGFLTDQYIEIRVY